MSFKLNNTNQYIEPRVYEMKINKSHGGITRKQNRKIIRKLTRTIKTRDKSHNSMLIALLSVVRSI